LKATGAREEGEGIRIAQSSRTSSSVQEATEIIRILLSREEEFSAREEEGEGEEAKATLGE